MKNVDLDYSKGLKKKPHYSKVANIHNYSKVNPTYLNICIYFMDVTGTVVYK